MNWHEIGLVWRKELLDILRDRRTIMAMIVVPLLVYPVLIIVISQLGIAQVERIRASRARVAVLPQEASPSLMTALHADTTFLLVQTDQPAIDLRERTLDALIRVPEDFEERVARMDSVRVIVSVDLSRDRGEKMRDRVRDFLVDWRESLVTERLTEEDLSPNFVKPFAFRIHNVAGGKRMGGSIIGRILPFFLVVMMISGAFYPAIDVTAGERERGTLETLLVVPAKRFNIVMGKFLTVFMASIVTTLVNLFSIAFTVFVLIGNVNMGGNLVASMAGLLDWRALGLIFILMIPMAILMSALSMMVASFARSFKEAQNYLSPLMIVCMAPAYLSFLPGVEISTTWAMVPIANVVLLSRELLMGNYVLSYLALTLGTMTTLALLLLNRTVELFGNETMLGGVESAPRFSLRQLLSRDKPQRTEHLTTGVVVPVFLMVLLGFFYVGTPIQLSDVRGGVILTQVFIIAGIPILSLRLMRIPVGRSLGLDRWLHPAVIPLTLLFAPAATLLAALIGIAQGVFLEVPESYRELMERLFQFEGSTGLLSALVAFALVPAVCEEILFRGFVLHGMARRMHPTAAIFWSALLFGAFHFDLYRLLPTTALGVLLGTLVWLTGSLWPAILLHACNNTIAILANTPPVADRFPWLAAEGGVPWTVVGVIAGVGILAAVGLVRLRRPGNPLLPHEEPAPLVAPAISET